MQKTQTNQLSLTSPQLNPEAPTIRRNMGRAGGLINFFRPAECPTSEEPAPGRIRVHVTPGDVGDVLLQRFAARAGFIVSEEIKDDPVLVFDFARREILSDGGKAWPEGNPTTVSLDRALILLSHCQGQTAASGVQK